MMEKIAAFKVELYLPRVPRSFQAWKNLEEVRKTRAKCSDFFGMLLGYSLNSYVPTSSLFASKEQKTKEVCLLLLRDLN